MSETNLNPYEEKVNEQQVQKEHALAQLERLFLECTCEFCGNEVGIDVVMHDGQHLFVGQECIYQWEMSHDR